MVTIRATASLNKDKEMSIRHLADLQINSNFRIHFKCNKVCGTGWD